jgi:hypothetical protein
MIKHSTPSDKKRSSTGIKEAMQCKIGPNLTEIKEVNLELKIQR